LLGHDDDTDILGGIETWDTPHKWQIPGILVTEDIKYFT